MEKENKKYAIELEVITPLCVGAGNDNEWMRGIDYVQKDGKVYVLDIAKAVNQGIDIERLTTLFSNSDEKGISLLIGNKLEDVSRYVFKAPASTINPIKSFMRTQLFDKPVVVGSSLKGSVRSALFKYLRTDEETNEEVFGRMKDGTDFMRFIRIADIEMPSTVLVNSKIFNLRKEGSTWFGGWKHKGTDGNGNSHTDQNYMPTGFNTLYECVAPGKKGYGSITLAESAFSVMYQSKAADISHSEKKKDLMTHDISHLFMAVNNVTREYLRKERDFFLKYPAERSDELIANIDYLLSLIPTDGSCCLLKMSAGVGFHSITGDWQYDDYDDTDIWQDRRNYGKKKYKSRKTAEYNGRLQLMGFVRLLRLTDEEAAHYEQSLQQEHLDIAEGILAPIRASETAKQQKLEEERLQQLAKAEEKRKQQVLQDLLERSRQLYNENNWDEAIAKLEEANAACPDNADIVSLLEKCKNAKAVDEFQKRQQAATQQRFSQPLSEVIMGKTSAGNLVGTTQKWLKVDGHSMGEQECDAFISEARKLAPQELKKLKGKLSDLKKLAGESIIQKLCTELSI